jgi:hypothetical protein
MISDKSDKHSARDGNEQAPENKPGIPLPPLDELNLRPEQDVTGLDFSWYDEVKEEDAASLDALNDRLLELRWKELQAIRAADEVEDKSKKQAQIASELPPVSPSSDRASLQKYAKRVATFAAPALAFLGGIFALHTWQQKRQGGLPPLVGGVAISVDEGENLRRASVKNIVARCGESNNKVLNGLAAAYSSQPAVLLEIVQDVVLSLDPGERRCALAARKNETVVEVYDSPYSATVSGKIPLKVAERFASGTEIQELEVTPELIAKYSCTRLDRPFRLKSELGVAVDQRIFWATVDTIERLPIITR